LQELKITDQIAGLENAIPEIDETIGYIVDLQQSISLYQWRIQTGGGAPPTIGS